LILNAGARDDEAEYERLSSSAPRITLSMSHHAPYAEAFHEIAEGVFLELIELAAEYYDALERADDDMETLPDREGEEDDDGADDAVMESDGGGVDDVELDGDSGERSLANRRLSLFLATGYFLKTKVAGWQRWCEQRHLPPFRAWEMMPGYARLQRALKLVQEVPYIPGGAAFTSKGMLLWLNRVRPTGDPELSTLPLTVEGLAAALETLFQERVRYHGGD
jgi:hypothetical protein